MAHSSSQLSADAACFVPSWQPTTTSSTQSMQPTATSCSWIPHQQPAAVAQAQPARHFSPNTLLQFQHRNAFGGDHEMWRQRVWSEDFQTNSWGRGRMMHPQGSNSHLQPSDNSRWMPSGYSTFRCAPPPVLDALSAPFTPASCQVVDSLAVSIGQDLRLTSDARKLQPSGQQGSSVERDESADVDLSSFPQQQQEKKKKKRKRKKITIELGTSSSVPASAADSDGKQNSFVHSAATPVYIDDEAQTDFPETLSRASLSEVPNLLYKPESNVHVETAPSAPDPIAIPASNKRTSRQNRSSSSGFPKTDTTHVRSRVQPASVLHGKSQAEKDSIEDDACNLATDQQPVPSTSSGHNAMSWARVLSDGKPKPRVDITSSRSEHQRGPSGNILQSSSTAKSSASKSPGKPLFQVSKLPNSDGGTRGGSHKSPGAKYRESMSPAASRPDGAKYRTLTPSRSVNQMAAGGAAGSQSNGSKNAKSEPRIRSTSRTPKPEIPQQSGKSVPNKTGCIPVDSNSNPATVNQAPPAYPADGTSTGRVKVRGKKKNKKNPVSAASSTVEPVRPVIQPVLPVPQVDDVAEFPSLVGPSERLALDDGYDLPSKNFTYAGSYSSAAARPASKSRVPSASSSKPEQSETSGKPTAGSKAVNGGSARKDRSNSRTQKPAASQPQMSGKKFRQPITFSFEAMIDRKKDTAHVSSKMAKSAKLLLTKTEQKGKKDASGPVHRLLSSTVKKRGKEREKPKVKKPSNLRKVILCERESRRQKFLRDLSMGVYDSRVSHFLPAARSLLAGGRSAGDDLDPSADTEPGGTSPVERRAMLLSQIHSRRFREYCNQILNKEIDTCCTQLLLELVRFQDRLYNKDPVKAKIKRRYVLGLREVTKHLKLRKLKCVVISPNVERVQSKGGLDEALYGIIRECQDQNVPFVFALSRKALGRACVRKVPVSVVGIFNYEGAEQYFRQLLELTGAARQAYADMVSAVEDELAAELAELAAEERNADCCRSRSPSVLSSHSVTFSEPLPNTDFLQEMGDTAARVYYSDGDLRWSDVGDDSDDDDDPGNWTELNSSKPNVLDAFEEQQSAIDRNFVGFAVQDLCPESDDDEDDE